MRGNTINKKTIIGIIISSICVYFAFRGIDWSVVFESIAKVKIPYLLIVTVIYIFGYLIRSFRWHFLLRGVKKVPALKLFPHIMIGFFLNNILPMRIGEFARAYTSGKKLSMPVSASFGSIVLERTFDGLCFIIIFLISFNFMPFPGWVKRGGVAAGIFFLGMMVVLVIVSFNEDRAYMILSRIPVPKVFKEKIEHFMGDFFMGLRSLRSVKMIGFIIISSLCIWGIELLCFYLMSLAFQLHIELIHVVFIAMCVVLGVMVPAAPGYIGTYELAGRAGLEISGVDPHVGISFILFLHFFQFIIIAALGIPSLLLQQISMKEIKLKK